MRTPYRRETALRLRASLILTVHERSQIRRSRRSAVSVSPVSDTDDANSLAIEAATSPIVRESSARKGRSNHQIPVFRPDGRSTRWRVSSGWTATRRRSVVGLRRRACCRDTQPRRPRGVWSAAALRARAHLRSAQHPSTGRTRRSSTRRSIRRGSCQCRSRRPLACRVWRRSTPSCGCG